MNIFTLAKQSLTFYWRKNVGLFLTAVVSAAILTGALLVGDSVRYSLRRIVELRLGNTQLALVSQGRFFGQPLAERLSKELDADVAPVLQLSAMAGTGDGGKSANRIAVLGVDDRFFAIAQGANPFEEADEGIVLNQQLAARLGVTAGDEVVLRIGKPGKISRDVGLMPDTDLSVVHRGEVKAVITEDDFGRFSLAANQVAPLNAFVPLSWLAEKIDQSGLCNTLLLSSKDTTEITLARADIALKESLTLNDMALEISKPAKRDEFEIRSRRVFIDDFLSGAAMSVKGAKGHLTYFVNELRLDDNSTPYSMVTAIDKLGVADDEIVISRWLADDLSAKIGDTIELAYYIAGPMRKLEVHTNKFTVRDIIPTDSPLADREFMPDFPGLADEENCRDWDLGIPVDLDKIRDKDEVYWDDYRGTPKAFITLAAGQNMWANRFGNLTGIRYKAADTSQEKIAAEILVAIDPSQAGLFFTDVGSLGIKASGQSTDFGQLFLGLSMFLIFAAMILTGLVFGFGVDKRSAQTGMLLAVGFSAPIIRIIYLTEAAAVALAGAAVGSLAGLFYTKAMILGLATVWKDAVSGTAIQFHANIATIVIGAVCGLSVSLFSVWITLRRHLRKQAHQLLSSGEEQFLTLSGKAGYKKGLWFAMGFLIAAVGIVIRFSDGESTAVAGAFFSAGSLLLIAGILLSRALLKGLSQYFTGSLKTLSGFAFRNATRRSSRSVAVIAMLAAGSFLVVSIGAFRHDPHAHADRRDSGTGGFAIFAESAIGVLHDLNSTDQRKILGLDETGFQNVRVVQMRLRDGDDASCLNLNRAQSPRVIGVDPIKFQARRAFGKVRMMEDSNAEDVWTLLEKRSDDNTVNAVADNATVVWALGKKLGDSIEFVDDKGSKFNIRIVGVMANSILQGSLIISQENFIERFPSEDGYRMFLVDADPEVREQVSEKLNASLADFGIDVVPAARRLADFAAVENTYLSIFQLLGGLGLVLGSVGLGLVVLINVLERRGELAMLRAVGFDRITLKRMIVIEHACLLVFGLICGVAAALVATSPAFKAPGAKIPVVFLAIMTGFIAFNGIMWIWFSTAVALRGKLTQSLRNE